MPHVFPAASPAASSFFATPSVASPSSETTHSSTTRTAADRFSSGLVQVGNGCYWLASNLLSLAQQHPALLAVSVGGALLVPVNADIFVGGGQTNNNPVTSNNTGCGHSVAIGNGIFVGGVPVSTDCKPSPPMPPSPTPPSSLTFPSPLSSSPLSSAVSPPGSPSPSARFYPPAPWPANNSSNATVGDHIGGYTGDHGLSASQKIAIGVGAAAGGLAIIGGTAFYLARRLKPAPAREEVQGGTAAGRMVESADNRV